MTYKDLRVWQKADELALEIYRMTKKFPKDEIYGLTSQLRRAALSVPTNIVEGYEEKEIKSLQGSLIFRSPHLQRLNICFLLQKSSDILKMTITVILRPCAAKWAVCYGVFTKR